MGCFFYILFSATKDKFYIGHTCEPIEERLRKHNSNHRGFTGRNADWRVVYSERFTQKSDAHQRERLVKWKSRKRMEDLIGKKEI
jgi:putative endonuclease